MDDIRNASILFAIFGGASLLYGRALAATGDKDLLPYRLRHTVATKEDVRGVGRGTMATGAVILGLAVIGLVASSA